MGFSYNPAGQILSRTSDNDAYAWTAHYNVNRGYTANGLNRYAQAGAVALGYDGRGNLNKSGSEGYEYTAENWLSIGGGHYLQYDPLQRPRTIHTPNWSTHRSLNYDGDMLIVEYDANGISRRYVHGPGVDEPLVWYEGAARPTAATSTPTSAARSSR